MRINLKSKGSISKRDQSAFSLMEVIIGIVVAVSVMGAVYAGVASGFQTMQLTRENLRATQILVERLEAIRGSTWFNLTNDPPRDFSESQYLPVNGAASGVTYTGTITIQSPANVIDFTTNGGTVPAYANTDNLRAITITLTWPHRMGAGHYRTNSRTMSTFVSEYGLQSYVARQNQ